MTLTARPRLLRIAIDGPAASGKSAVGRAVARRLDCLFVDTGAMYRAFTWLVLESKIDPASTVAVAALSSGLNLQLQANATGVDNRVIVNGLDTTPHLRDQAVEQHVSLVSAIPEVRDRMVVLQRQIAAQRVVMAGRDIGTVVLPWAEVKIYLDASPEERARRRTAELAAAGHPASYDAILEQMRTRDAIDSGRSIAPLRAADDAVRLTTDGMDLESVIERVVELACRAGA